MVFLLVSPLAELLLIIALLEEFLLIIAWTVLVVGKTEKKVFFTRRCVRYALKEYLGWRWGKVRPRKTKGDADRKDVIVAYLRDFGRALKLEREGKAVLVYTDESYLHQNHAPGKSWISMNKDGDVIDRGTSRGRRLVMLHAITRDGPLVTNDAAGNPIETLQWKAKATDKKETDTPHPIDGADGETLTAELLWVAQSHTGDYHDNVRSNRQHKRGVLEL